MYRDIDCFVPANSIGWIWYDTTHYLVPDDKVGEETFSVIREAMAKSNTRAISRVVLYHRERAVPLEPRDRGMVLWTLRYGDEVRDEAEYFKGIKGKPDPKQKKQLASVIAEHTPGWSPLLATDPVEQALRSMITAKEKRARPSTKKHAAAKGGKTFATLADLHADALVIGDAVFFTFRREQLVALASRYATVIDRVRPKIRFAKNSPLEERRFEPSVPP